MEIVRRRGCAGGRERRGEKGFKGEKREFIVGEKGLKSSLIIINKGLNILKFLLY
jgi:hypothetical protein